MVNKKGLNILSEDISRKLGRVALKTQAIIKKDMPVITSRARNSVVISKNEDGTWVVGSNLSYMPFIELDTQPHIITPKNKKALSWVGAAHPVKKVMHPGTTGKFIFLKASIIAQGFMEEEFKK